MTLHKLLDFTEPEFGGVFTHLVNLPQFQFKVGLTMRRQHFCAVCTEQHTWNVACSFELVHILFVLPQLDQVATAKPDLILEAVEAGNWLAKLNVVAGWIR